MQAFAMLQLARVWRRNRRWIRRPQTAKEALIRAVKGQRAEYEDFWVLRNLSLAVRRGETLSHIAQRELGSARLWRDILALNEGLDPKRMREGTRLNMPTGEAIARKQAAPLAPASQPKAARANSSGSKDSQGYTVLRGDTLSQIALDELGRAGRGKESGALNPGLDPKRLLAGTRIRLPVADPSTAMVAKSPSKPAPARPRDVARVTSSERRVR